MARLIDADAIRYRKKEEYCGNGNSRPILYLYDVDIAEMPTVDAVEVVHGRWVNPYINRYGHPCHCCSVCGFKASYQDRNYCPNCGAKMDGGNEDG